MTDIVERLQIAIKHATDGNALYAMQQAIPEINQARKRADELQNEVQFLMAEIERLRSDPRPFTVAQMDKARFVIADSLAKAYDMRISADLVHSALEDYNEWLRVTTPPQEERKESK